MKIMLLFIALAVCAWLSACAGKPQPPVASVSRSLTGQTVTTYHHPDAPFYSGLKDFFPSR